MNILARHDVRYMCVRYCYKCPDEELLHSAFTHLLNLTLSQRLCSQLRFSVNYGERDVSEGQRESENVLKYVAKA